VDTDPVRLEAQQLKAIREEVRLADAAAEIYLFGSRVDDAARGGDIDLLVVSDILGFRELLRLRTRILDRIGWQQLDLVVRRRDQRDEPLAALARATGIRL
jgi:predicted nucleotidyltransferase